MSSAAESIYLRLVTGTVWPLEELAQEFGMTRNEAEAAVSELVELGLADLTPCGAAALPPGPVLEAVAEQRAHEAMLARESAAALARVWNAHVDPPSYIEMHVTASAVHQAWRRLLNEPAEEIRMMSSRPPGPAESAPPIALAAMDSPIQGVLFRVVCDAQALKFPSVLTIVQQSITAGHQARVFPGVPIDLILGERQALLTAPAFVPDQSHALVVHRSPLYDGLDGVFESFWRMGVPACSSEPSPVEGAEVPQETRRLLALLSSGLTDESIAREFGLSERTISRRISRLQEVLCAGNRFQLGVQAARRGWL